MENLQNFEHLPIKTNTPKEEKKQKKKGVLYPPKGDI